MVLNVCLLVQQTYCNEENRIFSKFRSTFLSAYFFSPPPTHNLWKPIAWTVHRKVWVMRVLTVHGSLFPDWARITLSLIVVQIEEARYSILILRDIVFLIEVGTVDILTMHNAGPQLFLCIVRFYARSDVSHSVTICHLCQKCHTSNMVSIFMGEKLLPKKELREVCRTELLEQYSLYPSRGFCFFRPRSSCHF